MKQRGILITGLVIIVLFAGVYIFFVPHGPRVLIILPSVYPERAINESMDELGKAGIPYDVAGYKTGVYSLTKTKNRPNGYDVHVNLDFDSVNVDYYSAVLVIPGEGENPKSLWTDQNAEKLFRVVRGAGERNMVLASIDSGVVVLARSGVLKNHSATSSNILLEKADIINGGGTYVKTDILVDGNIITAFGESNTRKLLEELIKKIKT